MKIRALKVFVPFKNRSFEQTTSIPDNNSLSSDFDDLIESQQGQSASVSQQAQPPVQSGIETEYPSFLWAMRFNCLRR